MDNSDHHGCVHQYKTQMCKFHSQGRCTKGAECTFAHSWEDRKVGRIPQSTTLAADNDVHQQNDGQGQDLAADVSFYRMLGVTTLHNMTDSAIPIPFGVKLPSPHQRPGLTRHQMMTKCMHQEVASSALEPMYVYPKHDRRYHERCNSNMTTSGFPDRNSIIMTRDTFCGSNVRCLVGKSVISF